MARAGANQNAGMNKHSFVTLLTRRFALSTALSVAFAALGGCSSVQPTRSGFFADYEAFTPLDGDDSVLVAPVAGVDWRRYDSFVVEPIAIDPRATAAAPAEVAALRDDFALHLRSELAEVLRPVDVAGERTVRVRAALTDLDDASPWINVPTLLLIGLPFDNGGASAEILVLGPDGAVLHRETSAATGSVMAFWNVFGHYGFTRWGIEGLAEGLAARIAEGQARSTESVR